MKDNNKIFFMLFSGILLIVLWVLLVNNLGVPLLIIADCYSVSCELLNSLFVLIMLIWLAVGISLTIGGGVGVNKLFNYSNYQGKLK